MLSRRTLRAMKARWSRDLASLEEAYRKASALGDDSNSETETIRNLATAIAEIDGLITLARAGDRTPKAVKGHTDK